RQGPAAGGRAEAEETQGEDGSGRRRGCDLHQREEQAVQPEAVTVLQQVHRRHPGQLRTRDKDMRRVLAHVIVNFWLHGLPARERGSGTQSSDSSTITYTHTHTRYYNFQSFTASIFSSPWTPSPPVWASQSVP